MLRRLRAIINDQKGFTLIEMIVVVAIIGLISGAVAGTVSQVFVVNAQSTARMTAVKQVESAVHWISRDAQMAQIVLPSGGPGFPLNLSWKEWNNTTNNVSYALQNGELLRSHSINGSAPSQTVIAEHINTDTGMTEFNYDSGVVIFKLTASVSGFRQASETRVVKVIPRSGL